MAWWSLGSYLRHLAPTSTVWLTRVWSAQVKSKTSCWSSRRSLQIERHRLRCADGPLRGHFDRPGQGAASLGGRVLWLWPRTRSFTNLSNFGQQRWNCSNQWRFLIKCDKPTDPLIPYAARPTKSARESERQLSAGMSNHIALSLPYDSAFLMANHRCHARLRASFLAAAETLRSSSTGQLGHIKIVSLQFYDSAFVI